MIQQLLEMILRSEPKHPDWTCLTNYDAIQKEIVEFKLNPDNLKRLRNVMTTDANLTDNQAYARLLMEDDMWKRLPSVKAEVEAHLSNVN